MRRLLVVLALLAGLAAAPAAGAGLVTKKDDEGRPIRFDVRAPDVDVDWYADLLRRAAHDDEIGRVVIRILPSDEIVGVCGEKASACYDRNTLGGALIVVPAGMGSFVARTLIHEYAHHVDDSYDVPGMPEPNGMPAWWAARDMARLSAAGEVSRTYALGWDRSIGEVFAEDYTMLHLRTEYEIPWLAPPDPAVLGALRRDVPGAPAEPIDLKGSPFVSVRSGTLGRSTPFTLPFTLLGPGRRVTFTARVAGAQRKGVRARIVLRCNGGPTVTRAVTRGRTAVTLDRRGLGPATCTIALNGTGTAALKYTATLRLVIEAPRLPA